MALVPSFDWQLNGTNQRKMISDVQFMTFRHWAFFHLTSQAVINAMWGAWMFCWKCQRYCKIELIGAHGFSTRLDGRCSCWPSFWDSQNYKFFGSSCALVMLMSLRLLFHTLFFTKQLESEHDSQNNYIWSTTSMVKSNKRAHFFPGNSQKTARHVGREISSCPFVAMTDAGEWRAAR